MGKQTHGIETWSRLLEWQRGSTAAERLSSLILHSQNFVDIDPSHPIGGPDGKKDLVCKKDDFVYKVAVYFPKGQKKFSEIKKKFNDDLDNFDENINNGFIFVTNQELTLSNRKSLIEINENIKIEIFHLERLSSILDQPYNYGIRLEYLDIEMTKEDQLAYMAEKDKKIWDLYNFLKQVMASQKAQNDDQIKNAPLVRPDIDLFPSGFYNKNVHKCSFCNYGYKVLNDFIGISFSSNATITCPKCGNTEEYINF